MDSETHSDDIDKITFEAIEFLKKNLKDETFLVRFSGGKDSIVTEHIAKMSNLNYILHSTLTGIDPPEVTRFIRKNYPNCKFARPKQSFWHLITTANPPAGTGRGIKWCCTKIKEEPARENPIKKRVLGIRAEESSRRSKNGRINCFKDETHYHPIFNWKEWQIWEFIDRHKLKYPKLYDDGVHRIGCVICPNNHKHHDVYRKRYPNHFKCFEKQRRIKAWQAA